MTNIKADVHVIETEDSESFEGELHDYLEEGYEIRGMNVSRENGSSYFQAVMVLVEKGRGRGKPICGRRDILS